MKTLIFDAVLILALLLVGCGKKASAPNSSSPGGVPVAQAALAAWQQGDKLTAVNRFIQADWSAPPLFASESVLSLSEKQFKSLSNSERTAKSGEMMAQVESLKKLGTAVADAGREAAAKGGKEQARRNFTSLTQSGTALDSPDCLAIVQLVGKGFKKIGETELAKLPQ